MMIDRSQDSIQTKQQQNALYNLTAKGAIGKPLQKCSFIGDNPNRQQRRALARMNRRRG